MLGIEVKCKSDISTEIKSVSSLKVDISMDLTKLVSRKTKLLMHMTLVKPLLTWELSKADETS
jgi:hypothetical protein